MSKRPKSSRDNNPRLLSAKLHSLSHRFSPVCCSGEDRFPVCNADHVRDCMLFDQPPESGQKMWYQWAGPTAERPTFGATQAAYANFHEKGKRLFDGSLIVLLEKVARVLSSVQEQSNSNVAYVKEHLSTLADTPLFGERNDLWKQTMVLVHVPLLQQQTTHDGRFDEAPAAALDGTTNTTITVLETGEVTIAGKAYRPASSKDLLRGTRLVLSHDDIAMGIHYNKEGCGELLIGESIALDAFLYSEFPHGATRYAVDEVATRSLLFFPEWSETELSRARTDYAPSYVNAHWPHLIAATMHDMYGFPSYDIWVALLVRHSGDILRVDLPENAGERTQKTPWAWTNELLWHNTTSCESAIILAAASDLFEKGEALIGKEIFRAASMRAIELYPALYKKLYAAARRDIAPMDIAPMETVLNGIHCRKRGEEAGSASGEGSE